MLLRALVQVEIQRPEWDIADVFRAYWREYRQRYGTDKGRVLTVTTGERRLANLKSITEDAGGRKKFWFTTFAQVSPETVLTDRIWQVASKKGLYALT